MLKQRALPVEQLDQEALAAGADLVDTMDAYPRCVGLAAPQIGIGLRIIAVDASSHPSASASHGRLVVFNPRIIEAAGSDLAREGCQSLPDITARVRRAKRIRFEGLLPDGRRFHSISLGFEARALQHEIDHLDGVLILDRAASPHEIFQRRPEMSGE